MKKYMMIALAAAVLTITAASASHAAIFNRHYSPPAKKASFLHTRPHGAAHHIVKTAPHRKNDFANLNR